MKKTTLLLYTVLTVGTLTACSGGVDATTAVSQAAVRETADKDGTDRDVAEILAAGAEERSDEAEENSADTVTENPFSGKAAKVGCSATLVPFGSVGMVVDGNKTYVGVNIDIVKVAVERNDGQMGFVDMPFKDLVTAIQADQIDFCSGGMAPTAEGEETPDFGEVFFYPRNTIVYRVEGNYPDLDSLKGKEIACVFGTSYQQVAKGVEGAVAADIQGSPVCVEEVKSKKVNAYIVDDVGAIKFLRNNRGFKLSLMDKVDDGCFAIGFPKESPYYETFNNTLKEMMENGELDGIIAGHLNEQFILD